MLPSTISPQATQSKLNAPRSLLLPKPEGPVSVLCRGNVVLVGANGSGKTRLGAWIEIDGPQKDQVFRISAQKSLSMPDTVSPVSVDLAEKNLIYGNAQNVGGKSVFKWNQKPSTFALNDYDKLMTYLFSEEAEQNAKYKALQRSITHKVDPVATKLDLTKSTWERVLPHRELVVGGARLQTKLRSSTNTPYNASEMSDGERVIFYLIGQCLSAPPSCILIVDEPEMHIHKSVQVTLWEEIERLRTDCIFVYMTHDVDFAASQTNSIKVWLKSFDGSMWDWELIAGVESLPDALLLEILGSRRPTIFVEGDSGSFDVALYRATLRDYLIVPVGGCAQVIQSVKALRANNRFHNLKVFGLIDRDRRTEPEIDSLQSDQIFSLSVAEVENIFCTKEILSLVSRRLQRDARSDISQMSDIAFKKLRDETATQISLHATDEITFLLGRFSSSSKSGSQVETELQDYVRGIKVTSIYSDKEKLLNSIVANHDYDGLLKFYNRKSLVNAACEVFGMKNGEFQKMVIRFAESDSHGEFSAAVRASLGQFPV